jgi:hypothetical protein
MFKIEIIISQDLVSVEFNVNSDTTMLFDQPFSEIVVQFNFDLILVWAIIYRQA